MTKTTSRRIKGSAQYLPGGETPTGSSCDPNWFPNAFVTYLILFIAGAATVTITIIVSTVQAETTPPTNESVTIMWFFIIAGVAAMVASISCWVCKWAGAGRSGCKP